MKDPQPPHQAGNFYASCCSSGQGVQTSFLHPQQLAHVSHSSHPISILLFSPKVQSRAHGPPSYSGLHLLSFPLSSSSLLYESLFRNLTAPYLARTQSRQKQPKNMEHSPQKSRTDNQAKKHFKQHNSKCLDPSS